MLHHLILVLIALVVFAFPAFAQDEPVDTVIVKGTTLSGRVVSLKAGALDFRTQYGKGTIEILFTDLDAIETEDQYLIRFEDDKKARGRILGIEDGHLLVGEDPTSATRVPIDSIRAGISLVEYESSLISRLRYKYRHWKASFDFGMEFEEGAVNKRKFALGLNMNRRKAPTRLALDLRYRFETEQKEDKPKITTKDEFDGTLKGEYDLMGRFFLFALPGAEYDRPRGISFRAYPSAGVGYRLVESEKALLQVQGGAGYVTEEFIDFPDNEYAAAHIGLEGRYQFKRGIELVGTVLYLPGFNNPSEDWLFRTVIDLVVPVFDPLALKLRISNVNDNNPSPNVGNNKFTTTISLSVRF
jgi:putative salt-induced outer membrane protein YdiY